MSCPACGAAAEGVVCGACGRVLHESGRLPAGFVIGDRYEIRRFLGEGGMGTVYESYDRKLEERVALKLLKADFTHSQEMERRFRHEIKLARRLRHPNVCAIHEYGEAGPLRYIALELIEGTDLKRRLREGGSMAAAEGFRVSLQIAQGLDCIHKAGVVHRDLKASNVMLDRGGDVRLMDFGIAKQLGGEPTLGATAIGSIIGTPEYMSPEQGRGEPIDFRSDIYALGIVIYEIFTGDVPFRGDTPIATLIKTMQEPVDFDAPKARGIPLALRSVLLRALAKNAADRYASVEEMAAALAVARDAALGPGATSPYPATLVEQPAVTADATPAGSASTWITPPPIPPDVATRLTPPAPLRRPAATPPLRPERSALPLVLAALGVLVLLGIGGAVARFWPGAPPAAPETQPSAAAPSTTLTPSEPVQPSELFRRSASPAAEATPEPEPTATPALIVRPASVPPPTLAPTPRALVPTPAARPGLLQLYVKPWAEVTIDGQPAGTTPLRPVTLAAGTHRVRLEHPSYAPLVREVSIEPGATVQLQVNLPVDGERLP